MRSPRAVASTHSHAVAGKKRCRTVTKKVHGKKKRVRVCSTVAPKPPATSTATVTPSPTVTPDPTATPAPTDTATPTPIPTPAPTATSVPVGGQIGGIPCSTDYPSYHVHSHLTILAAGSPVVIPANIGIPPGLGCFYWLHTHDTTGILHVEAPGATPEMLQRLTLGSFFDIWGECLSATCVAGITAGEVRVFVNLQPYQGDPRAIPLGYHTDITVEVGPPFSPPQPYLFPPGYHRGAASTR